MGLLLSAVRDGRRPAFQVSRIVGEEPLDIPGSRCRGCYYPHMDFNPQDSGSASGFELLPEGTYEIEVIEAEERTSQKGNQMIALTLQAQHPDGYPVRVWDYLVSVSSATFKIEQFCLAAGLADHFKRGRLLATDCVKRKVTAKIEIESGRENFSDRNSIREYVTASTEPRPAGIATQPTAGPTPIDEGDIPF